MVYLSKIYTKSGDRGETSLGDGTRVPKDDPRIEAYGTVDELNGVLGAMLATAGDFADRELIEDISNDLFDVGADLCVPYSEAEERDKRLRISESQVKRLESAIDRLNENLSPLESFILPGGSPAAAWCHLARTVCRRSERRIVTLARATPLGPNVAVYMNRLSDLLFVLARHLNNAGADDVLWKPGRSQ